MAATDHLGPQFGKEGKFDPSGDIYGSPDSDFRYARVSPSGEVTKNSRNVANMIGKHRSEDIQMGMPTGATTDFRAPAMMPSHPSQPPDYRNKFKPVDPSSFGEGRWN